MKTKDLKIYENSARGLSFQKELFNLICKALRAKKSASANACKVLKEAKQGSLEAKQEAYLLSLGLLSDEIKRSQEAASLALVYFDLESLSPEAQKEALKNFRDQGFCTYELISAFNLAQAQKEFEAKKEAERKAKAQAEQEAEIKAESPEQEPESPETRAKRAKEALAQSIKRYKENKKRLYFRVYIYAENKFGTWIFNPKPLSEYINIKNEFAEIPSLSELEILREKASQSEKFAKYQDLNIKYFVKDNRGENYCI